MNIGNAIATRTQMAVDHVDAHFGSTDWLLVIRLAQAVVGWLSYRRQQKAIIKQRIEEAASEAFLAGMIRGAVLVLGLAVAIYTFRQLTQSS